MIIGTHIQLLYARGNQLSEIWLFYGEGGRFVGGAFTELDAAEAWIYQNRLTGVLTKTPVNSGVLDWAIETDSHNMAPETLGAKRSDPVFVGSFSSASQEHYHYEHGLRD